jgi:phasin family protein
MTIQKDYIKLLEKMSELSQNALDSFARLTEAATITSENLLRQQMEMFQLASGSNTDPLMGAAEITEVIFKKRERLARQQLDMFKLAIESSTEFLTENGDNGSLQDALKAQREFAENLSNKFLDSARSNLDLCFETQTEINQVVHRNLKAPHLGVGNVGNKKGGHASKEQKKGAGSDDSPRVRKKRRYPPTLRK